MLLKCFNSLWISGQILHSQRIYAISLHNLAFGTYSTTNFDTTTHIFLQILNWNGLWSHYQRRLLLLILIATLQLSHWIFPLPSMNILDYLSCWGRQRSISDLLLIFQFLLFQLKGRWALIASFLLIFVWNKLLWQLGKWLLINTVWLISYLIIVSTLLWTIPPVLFYSLCVILYWLIEH